VLKKEENAGKLRIISTTSAVSNPTDQRYCTGEVQLLAAVSWLPIFRIYVYRQQIELHTDSGH
jgi:hypothetical protein